MKGFSLRINGEFCQGLLSVAVTRGCDRTTVYATGYHDKSFASFREATAAIETARPVLLEGGWEQNEFRGKFKVVEAGSFALNTGYDLELSKEIARPRTVYHFEAPRTDVQWL